MLAAPLRKAVDGLWDAIWSAGISNPLTVVDYLTGVLLLCRMDEQDPVLRLGQAVCDAAEAGDVRHCTQLMGQVMDRFGLTAPDPLMWRDTALLGRVVRQARRLEAQERNRDILGDCFEYVLGHLNTAGHFGQFRTPRHIVQFLVAAINPRKGELVLDPACGTGGFLIAAQEHRGNTQGPYLGDECDWTMARIASANLILHGIGDATIRRRDALSDLNPEADVILANPPFAGSVDAERRREFESKASKSELLFVELMLRRLKPRGRAGVVVPTSVLTSSSSAALFLRTRLVEEQSIKAIIELPGGVFRPYTDVRTAMVIWHRAPPGKEPVWMLRARSDGYSLDDRRTPIEENDLPELLKVVRQRKRSASLDASLGRAVERDEVRKQGYLLNPSRYLEQVQTSERPVLDFSKAANAALRSSAQLNVLLQELEAVIHD